MDENGQSQSVPITTNNMKRPISLELNSGKPNAKKPKLSGIPLQNTFSLDSTNITTPDLEKIILPLLPTPSNNVRNVLYATNQNPTNEKEEFSMGFEKALQNLYKNDSQQQIQQQQQQQQNQQQQANSQTTSTTHTNGMSGGSFTYTHLPDEHFPVVVKEEPSANSTPPHSPIDMETQEKIKLERKRQRNRVAASKCRKRKLERISKLEERVKCLKGENPNLVEP
uniref:BZIP domain-containing protein n=1 Tax=Megaselia scalaris TaxID=36166 RepID=T1GEA4_MEGSC